MYKNHVRGSKWQLFLTKNTFVSQGKIIYSNADGKEEKHFDDITC